MRQTLILLLTICAFATVRAEDKTAPADLNRIFGVVEAYYRPEEAVELGVTWDRVVFEWNYFQPRSRGEFITTSIPHETLQQAQADNRQIVGLIKGTPAWASRSRSVGAVPEGIDLPYDHPDNVYGAFVRRLVEYYSQRGIHDWIIMNEPDVRHGEGVVEFQGNVRDYYHMLKTAYLAAKSVDPSAHIQIGGLAWWPDRNNHRKPYLERLLGIISTDPNANANGWYFDGVSLHIYYTTSTIWPIIKRHQQILLDFGLGDKEVWLDEFNASPRLDPLSRYDAPFAITLDQQANYIVQASALALAAGLERVAVYRLFDNHFVPGQEPWGLIRYDGTLRPAFYAYQQVIRRFDGVVATRRAAAPGATLVTLRFPDHTLYIMWSDSYAPGQFLINLGTEPVSVTVTDAVGEAQTPEIATDSGTTLGLVDVPAAEPTDMDWVVVSGAVRIAAIEGGPRSVWFRAPEGELQPMQ